MKTTERELNMVSLIVKLGTKPFRGKCSHFKIDYLSLVSLIIEKKCCKI